MVVRGCLCSALALVIALVHPGASRAGQALGVLPVDAWSEQQRAELAMQVGYDQRFALYGVAFHVLAQVMSEPSEHAEVVGYMRRGARFRAAQGRAGRGCDRTWHELATGGFVCAGRGFALSARPEGFAGAPVSPALYDPLPYRYAKNVAAVALQYWRIPTRDEALIATKMVAASPVPLVRAALGAADADHAADELKLPDFARMPMQPGFYVSVDREEQDGPRAFVRTVRGAYVEAKALVDVESGRAPGVVLHAASDLPLGIAHRHGTKLLERDPLSGQLRPAAPLARYSAVPLTDARVLHDGKSYLLTRSGGLVADSALRIVERPQRPPLVPRNARFIHVSLAQQTLVAYDGERPVFATLVSTGKQGYETPTGVFRIYAKHVSATMDGMAGNDEAYSIEDVPWTMYFQGSYALHAAFWHDHFGNVRSHGCVNLAPADARWLFRFATPVLPEAWHGVIATRDNPGTWVSID
jgi:lipoprotein-anchoring transpeptidase ErfK/SrfK